MKRIAAVTLGLLLLAAAPERRYPLQPQSLGDGIWLFEGARSYFSRDNGGYIANSAVIDTPQGAILIDTGPSQRFGVQLRAAIRAATGHDVIQVYVTHAHPDHFLGNEALADVPIAALPGTVLAIHGNGETLANNLYRLVGGWMEGTQTMAPTQTVTAGEIRVGGRKLQLLSLSGHTGADLAIYDEASHTLFAGDLVFWQRAPATPDADLGQWLAALDRLQALDFRRLVPGHGAVVRDARAIAQTRAYLQWTRDTLTQAAARGATMNELMRLPVPAQFSELAIADSEWQRTVSHLYPDIELRTLPVLNAGPHRAER